MHEETTAANMAAQLRASGSEVVERSGRMGMVGVLKNGAGTAVMVRIDMDALTIKAQTKLVYASTMTMRDGGGLPCVRKDLP